MRRSSQSRWVVAIGPAVASIPSLLLPGNAPPESEGVQTATRRWVIEDMMSLRRASRSWQVVMNTVAVAEVAANGGVMLYFGDGQQAVFVVS